MWVDRQASERLFGVSVSARRRRVAGSQLTMGQRGADVFGLEGRVGFGIACCRGLAKVRARALLRPAMWLPELRRASARQLDDAGLAMAA